MLPETARTRAIRRAQHDTYAPFVVRPAVRCDSDKYETLAYKIGALAILAFCSTFAAWVFVWIR